MWGRIHGIFLWYLVWMLLVDDDFMVPEPLVSRFSKDWPSIGYEEINVSFHFLGSSGCGAQLLSLR